MVEFTAVIEIWKDEKIALFVINMEGHHLPRQTDIEEREDILQSIRVGYPEYEILDLVSIVDKGQIVWTEMNV